jgi:hypothetical protein
MAVVYWDVFERFGCYLTFQQLGSLGCNESYWLVPGTFE